MEADLAREIWIIALEHGLGMLQHNVAALTSRHATQYQHMFDLVKFGIKRQRVAEVNADGFVDRRGSRITLGHERLHMLEPLGKSQLRCHLDAGGGQNFVHRLLRKIQRAHPAVARPFIGRGLGVDVDRCEGQLVEPTGHFSCGIDVARGLTRSHRDAKQAGDAERHRTGQRRDVTIVGHLERHTPLFAQTQKKIACLRQLVGRDRTQQ